MTIDDLTDAVREHGPIWTRVKQLGRSDSE